MSTYDTIGGAASVQAAVDDFYVRINADPSLAPYFAGRDIASLKEHQRAFIAAAIGGPEVYQGRPMRAVHQPLGITDAHFDAVVTHLLAAISGLGVPAPDRDRRGRHAALTVVDLNA
ncbi:group I truncated hemoglobin, partial [Frankia canadensis]|uniref:group I truncated hemoglobin n=1 Tax=Frankia canadensis TaxID=1836972 RepID=UPI000C795C19